MASHVDIHSSDDEPNPPPEGNVLSGLESRVSVLEERTKEKPKTWLEKVSAYAGIATFALALLYSFPLGVWDRWVLSPTNETRALVLKLSDIDAEVYKLPPNMPREQLMVVSNVASGKKAALLSADTKGILSRARNLSAPEIALLGYHFSSIGDLTSASEMLEMAWRSYGKDGPVDYFQRADLTRMRAEAIYPTSPVDARKLLSEAIKLYGLQQRVRGADAMAAWEWASSEYNFGSGPCSLLLAKWAAHRMELVDPAMAEEWTKHISGVTIANDQRPCDDQIIRAVVEKP